MSPHEATRLARRCAYSTDAHEWDKFLALITPVIAAAARQVCSLWSESYAALGEDIVQHTLARLCEENRRVLREFDDRGDDSFFKLLRVITSSVATDLFRRSHAEKRGGTSHTVSIDASSTFDVEDTRAVDSVERHTLLGEIDELLLLSTLITVRDRNLFWLYYQQGLTADAIAHVPGMGLTPKGVESALVRITRTLREALHPEPPSSSMGNWKPAESAKTKGFSSVVAIDSVKRS